MELSPYANNNSMPYFNQEPLLNKQYSESYIHQRNKNEIVNPFDPLSNYMR